MGTLRSHGGHLAIIESTETMTKTFCTPDYGRPQSSKEKHGSHRDEPQLDTELFNRHKIEFQAADAAADMKLAGRKMVSIFPNMLSSMWDLAHGFRRITSRPWASDIVIKEAINTCILAKSSIVQLIQNSEEFRDMYVAAKKATRSEFDPDSKNVAFAKHRWDSTTKPLGRFVLNFQAILAVANQITRLRRGKPEGKHAEDFLRFITNEKLLLLAMCADAADESNLLLRYVDQESYCVEEVPHQINMYLKRIGSLFNDGNCTEIGYTKVMVGVLEKTHVFFVAGKVRSVGARGGVSAAIVNRSVSRMVTWVRLAEAVVQAEYPECSVISAFSIFSLGKATDKSGFFKIDATAALTRLANFFHLDVGTLISQYSDMRTFACAVQSSNPELSAMEAWVKAVMTTKSKTTSSEHHPTSQLEQVLTRWLGWLPSSCALERNFSVMDKVVGPSARHASNDRQRDLFCIVTSKLNSIEKAQIFESSRALWAQHFGATRVFKMSRIDKGILRPRSSERSTEAEFLKRRRIAVGAVCATPAKGNIARGPRIWKEPHQKELDFQVAKKRARMLALGVEGQLLPEEKDADFDAETLRLLADCKKKDAEHQKNHRERKLILSHARPAPPAWVGKSVFLEITLADELSSAVRRLGLNKTEQRTCADVFVQHDVSALGGRVAWCLALKGGFVANPDFMKNSATGALVRHLPTSGSLWASVAFVEHNNDLFALIDSLVNRCPKWSWFTGSLEDFLHKAKRNSKRHGATLYGLVTKTEKSTQARMCDSFLP